MSAAYHVACALALAGHLDSICPEGLPMVRRELAALGLPPVQPIRLRRHVEPRDVLGEMVRQVRNARWHLYRDGIEVDMARIRVALQTCVVEIFEHSHRAPQASTGGA